MKVRIHVLKGMKFADIHEPRSQGVLSAIIDKTKETS